MSAAGFKRDENKDFHVLCGVITKSTTELVFCVVDDFLSKNRHLTMKKILANFLIVLDISHVDSPFRDYKNFCDTLFSTGGPEIKVVNMKELTQECRKLFPKKDKNDLWTNIVYKERSILTPVSRKVPDTPAKVSGKD